MPAPRMRSSATVVAMTVALALPATVAADTPSPIDFRFSVGAWQPELEGVVSSEGEDDFDVEGDLGFDDDSGTTFEAAFEHALPLLPNLRLRHVALDESANGTITSSRGFAGVEFSTNERVRSDYDLTMTDATIYYSPLDSWIALDVGITARYADLEVEIAERDGNRRARADGAAVIPLGHVSVRADLPVSGLYAAGRIDTISAGDNSLSDVSIGLGWETARLFGIEAGYRELSLELEDADDIEADVDIGGPYVSGSLRF